MSVSCFLLDNTALSNFSKAGRLDVLRALMDGRIFVPTEVEKEFLVGVKAKRVPGTEFRRALRDGWLQRLRVATDEEVELLTRYRLVLGAGEAACLALAKPRRGVIITDDRAARNLALVESIAHMGTVGVLMGAVNLHVLRLPAANALLRLMISHGYRSPVDSLDRFL